MTEPVIDGKGRTPQADFMLKAAIVVFVFPTCAWLFSAFLGMAMALVLYALPESQHGVALQVIQVVTLVIGLVCAFFISRWAWPKEA